jgi:hypothetical protein
MKIINKIYEMDKVEIAVSLLVIAIVAVGLISLFINQVEGSFYFEYVKEDGFVEWMSVFGLLACSSLCFYRFFVLKKYRPNIFLLFLIFQGLVCFFAAGEEMSWGQRLFNIELPDFFEKHNYQKEITVHNLVVKDIDVNRVFFGHYLDIISGFYLLIVPILYRKIKKVKDLCDKLAVPIPRVRHIILYIILNLAIQIPFAKRRWEIIEMTGMWILFIVMWNSFNVKIYKIK